MVDNYYFKIHVVWDKRDPALKHRGDKRGEESLSKWDFVYDKRAV